jgi:hypothetical protein
MSAPIIPDPQQVPFLPLWPETGRILGLSRSATYAAAARGEIATCQFGARRVVPCAWLRRKAQLDESGPA